MQEMQRARGSMFAPEVRATFNVARRAFARIEVSPKSQDLVVFTDARWVIKYFLQKLVNIYFRVKKSEYNYMLDIK